MTFTPPFRRLPYGSGHVYLDDLGRPVPSVTSILNAGWPKPALVNWAANLTAEYAVDHWRELARMSVSQRLKALQGARWERTRGSSLRGTAIHAAAEAIAKGEAPIIPQDGVAQVEAYRKWLADWSVEVIAVERVVGHEREGYAGTYDILAMVGGKPYLVDIKTSGSGAYPEAAIQLAAYKYATWSDHAATLARLGGADTAVLWLRPDSGYELLPVSVNEETFKTFLACRDIAAWAKANDGIIGSALAVSVKMEATA